MNLRPPRILRRPLLAAIVASLAIYFVASVFYRSKQIESDVTPAHGAFDAKEWKGADDHDFSTHNRAPADTASIVAEILQQHRVVIFSKTYCGYSRMAKTTFALYLDPSKVHVVELDTREDGDAIQTHMQHLTGARTVPRIFVDGVFLGGGDTAMSMEKSGALGQMLRQKGII